MNTRLAVVTGGTGAIGTEICLHLARAGCRVAAIGHPSEVQRLDAWRESVQRHDVAAHAVLCDLASYEAAAQALSQIQAELGPVDILVNAAGITRDARFTRMSPQQWREVLASNLDSVFNATHAVFAGMCERGWGRVVNISSVNGQKGQFGQANYSAAKAGMHGFAMALAQEGAARGVTVNTVSPGYIATPMTAVIKPEALAKIEQTIPLGRLGRPAEIARVVAFLAAEESAYITGANIPVNGGLYMSA